MDREAERKHKVAELLRQALAHLECDTTALEEAPRRDTYSSALWKIIDAAGLVAPICFKDAQGQLGTPTGRGFMLADGKPWLKHMHEPSEL